jgi:hypothetical protein
MRFHRASPAAALGDCFAQRYEYNQLGKGSSFPCSVPLYQLESMPSSCYANRRHSMLLFSPFGCINFHHAHCDNTLRYPELKIFTVEILAKLAQ